MMQQLEKFNNSNIKSYRIRQVSLIMLDVLIILLSSVVSMKLIEVNFIVGNRGLKDKPLLFFGDIM